LPAACFVDARFGVARRVAVGRFVRRTELARVVLGRVDARLAVVRFAVERFAPARFAVLRFAALTRLRVALWTSRSTSFENRLLGLSSYKNPSFFLSKASNQSDQEIGSSVSFPLKPV
jgi:hypothetical protein